MLWQMYCLGWCRCGFAEVCSCCCFVESCCAAAGCSVYVLELGAPNAPLLIFDDLFPFIVGGCVAVGVAECGGGFLEWGVSGGLVFALVLLRLVDA